MWTPKFVSYLSTGQASVRLCRSERKAVTFEESMWPSLEPTDDIAQPSGDERLCFLPPRETASAECMLTAVPRD